MVKLLTWAISLSAYKLRVKTLALLYLRQGRTAELKTLAREMLPIFRSQDVYREAVAALVLFQEAIREEQITAAFVRELAGYLDAARTDPTLRFRQPTG